MPVQLRFRCAVEQLDARLVLSQLGAGLTHPAMDASVASSWFQRLHQAPAAAPAPRALISPTHWMNVDAAGDYSGTLSSALPWPEFHFRGMGRAIDFSLSVAEIAAESSLRIEVLDESGRALVDSVGPAGSAQLSLRLPAGANLLGQVLVVRISAGSTASQLKSVSYTLDVNPADASHDGSSDLLTFLGSPSDWVVSEEATSNAQTHTASAAAVSDLATGHEHLGQSSEPQSLLAAFPPLLGPDPTDEAGTDSPRAIDHAIAGDWDTSAWLAELDASLILDPNRDLVDAPGGPASGAVRLIDGEIRLIANGEIDPADLDGYSADLAGRSNARRRAQLENSAFGLLSHGAPVVVSLAGALLFVNAVVLERDWGIVKKILCRRQSHDGPLASAPTAV
jgi:hypothetical protein